MKRRLRRPHAFSRKSGFPITHPYKDAEVVEWHARISLARELDGDEPLRVCDAVTRLHDRYGVTHFVRPSRHRLVCYRLVTAFRDDNFLIQQWL